MKRILPVLLCIFLLIGALPVTAYAAEQENKAAAESAAQTAEDSADVPDDTPDLEIADKQEEDLAETGWSLVSEAQFQAKLSALRSKYVDGSVWAGVYYEYGMEKASTCWAYACQMMYEVFGAMFYSDGIYSKYLSYDGSVLNAGDWVRIDYNSHSIFITKVTSEGVYFTDGNGTGVYNQVRWDGFYSWSEINSRFTYKVHLPGNNLLGADPVHTVAYSGNGADGSMGSSTYKTGESFKLKQNGYTYSGMSFQGYTVKRSYDNTWYTTDAGWQTLSDIRDNNYTFKVYPAGSSYTLGKPWLGTISANCTFTFYAQWLPDNSIVEFMDNYSGYNYLLGSDFSDGFSSYIYSRDKSAYTLSYDASERFNNQGSLKVVGKSAGASGSDLAFRTSTNAGLGDGYSQTGEQGDDKDMTLRISVKSPADGAKLYIRWGYQSTYQSVTLSKGWKTYNISLPKNPFFGATLHPYFDKAGTYYINSVSLADGSWNTGVMPESGEWSDAMTVSRGTAIGELPTPAREGYTFLGWYTAAEYGDRVTESTVINACRLKLYAHWSKDVSYTPIKTLESNGHVYELYDNVMQWEDAEAFCEELGGHLVTVDSFYENNTVYNMISDRQGYCWLGLRYDKADESWKWANGEAYFFNYWYHSSYGTDDSGEYYAMMYPMNVGTTPYAGTWDKVSGSAYRRSYYGYYNSFFICEYDTTEYLGDADGNGVVEITDATAIQLYDVDLATGIDEDVLMNGDVNRDGTLELIDATFIQRWALDMATPYPIGKRAA